MKRVVWDSVLWMENGEVQVAHVPASLAHLVRHMRETLWQIAGAEDPRVGDFVASLRAKARCALAEGHLRLKE